MTGRISLIFLRHLVPFILCYLTANSYTLMLAEGWVILPGA
jgi:hypothetical protein